MIGISWSKLMKFKLLMAACLGLMPYNIWAQVSATKECRTLEAAGNFIGADEALVDGMVCKIAKNKATSPATIATTGIVAEASGKPMVRSVAGKTTSAEEKANPALPPAEPSANTRPHPGDAAIAESIGGIQGVTLEVNRAPSVAEVARAYREMAKQRAAENSASLAVSKTPTVSASPAKVEAPSAAAPPASPTMAEPKAEIRAGAPAVKPAVTAETKPRVDRVKSTATAPVAPTSASAPVTPPVTKSAAAEQQAPPEIRMEAASHAAAPVAPATPGPPTSASAPMIQPLAKSAVAEEQAAPEMKIEGLLATPTLEAPPSEPKTGVLDTTVTTEPIAKDEVRQALPSTDSDSSSDRPQVVKMGIFEPPQESTDMEKTAPPIDPFGSPLEDTSNQGPRPGCTKIVSLGSMENDRLVLATPDWAMQWLEKNQKKYPGVCFSDTPSAGVPNYLIVFSTAAPAAQQIEPVTTKPASDKTSAGSANGTFTTNFGSTWHYTYEKATTTTVTTDWNDKVPHNLQMPTLYATAYTERGIPVSQHWPALTKGEEKGSSKSHGSKQDPLAAAARAMGELLGQMLADIPLQ
jgi:hypothetical protein